MLKVGGLHEAGDFLLPSPLETLPARFCCLWLEKSLTGTDEGN